MRGGKGTQNISDRSEQDNNQLSVRGPRRQMLRNDRESKIMIDDAMMNIARIEGQRSPLKRKGKGKTRPKEGATRRKDRLLLLKHFWQLDRAMMLRDLQMCIDRMPAIGAYRYVCRLGIVHQSNNLHV